LLPGFRPPSLKNNKLSCRPPDICNNTQSLFLKAILCKKIKKESSSDFIYVNSPMKRVHQKGLLGRRQICPTCSYNTLSPLVVLHQMRHLAGHGTPAQTPGPCPSISTCQAPRCSRPL